MSQPSIYPALQVKTPDFINALQQYANVQKTDAETQTELQKPDYVRSQSELNRANVGLVGAQSVKAQVDAELARINLGVSQYGLDALRSGGNAGTEALPGQSAEGTSYAQPDVDPARYATATPPPTTAQQAVVDAAAAKYGVPKEVAYWVGTHESGWNRDAVGPETSHGKAQGAWQFMGDTAKQYGVNDPTDFASSTDGAMHYLADLYKKTGDWGAAIQAYGTFSTGRGTGRDAAVREGFNQYAKGNGLAVAARTQVAAAGNGPASWGVRSDGSAAPAAVVSGGNPNALSVANPMGTSSQGIMLPGLGVALPKFQAMSVLAAPDKAKAINEAIQQRRLQLGQLAGGATDAASWNQAVATAWRTGWITNGEFQRWYNAPDWQGMRDTIVKSMAPPEAQLNYRTALTNKNLVEGEGGRPVPAPELAAGSGELVTVKMPIIDETTGKQKVDSQGFGLTRDVQVPKSVIIEQHGGPGGTALRAPPPAASAPPPGPAPAPPPTAAAPPPAGAVGDGTGPVVAPPPAQTAPNGGTVSGVGAANGAPMNVPAGMEPAKGTDGNWYLKPVQGAGPAAPAVPSVSGTVTAPAPGAAAPPPASSMGGGPQTLPPGAAGAGGVNETPGTKSDIAVEQAKREAAIEVAKQAQIEQNKQTIEIANTEGKKVAESYGEQAGQIAKNGIMASANLEKLDVLEAAAKEVQTGPTAAIRTAAVNRIIDTLGLLGVKVPEGLARQAAAAGAIDKLGGFLAAAQVRMLGQREAASVFEAIKGFNPHLGQNPQAFNAVLQSLRQDAIRDQDLEAFRLKWTTPTAEGGLGHNSIAGMMPEFNKEHSPLAYASRVIQPPLPPKDQLQNNVIYRAKNGQKFLWLNGTMVEAQ